MIEHGRAVGLDMLAERCARRVSAQKTGTAKIWDAGKLPRRPLFSHLADFLLPKFQPISMVCVKIRRPSGDNATRGEAPCLMLNSGNGYHCRAIWLLMTIDLPTCVRLNEKCRTVLQ